MKVQTRQHKCYFEIQRSVSIDEKVLPNPAKN